MLVDPTKYPRHLDMREREAVKGRIFFEVQRQQGHTIDPTSRPAQGGRFAETLRSRGDFEIGGYS